MRGINIDHRSSQALCDNNEHVKLAAGMNQEQHIYLNWMWKLFAVKEMVDRIVAGLQVCMYVYLWLKEFE